MVASGLYTPRNLVEVVEIPDHPFFVGVQYHPEFKSRPLEPHPLFREFVKAALAADVPVATEAPLETVPT
jgi:CTP synthase